MKRHKLETNFGFIRDLENAKTLNNIKIGNWYENFEYTEETLFRCIYYKKAIAEFKPPIYNRRAELTEYKNNIVVNKQKVKR